MDPSAITAQVLENNRQARDARERWAPHRAHVMAVLRRVAAAGPHLALLGAGHLHDVDLDELLEQHRQITLVDLDRETVTTAVARHPGAEGRCNVRAPVDLAGLLAALPQVDRGPSAAQATIARLAVQGCEVDGAPFDLTVSLGVLTQLVQAVIEAGFSQVDVPAVALAVRDKHLRDLLDLTRQGGTFVLVTDFVSSATAPEIAAMPRENLVGYLPQLMAQRNFFTGTNPYRMLARLQQEEPFRGRIGRAGLAGPWLWQVTAQHTHLTGAIVAETRVA
jgi:hypothetical protein